MIQTGLHRVSFVGVDLLNGSVKRIAALVTVTTLVACANPGIVQTSPDEFLLARSDKADVFGNAAAIKTDALREAEGFAKSRGMILLPISIHEVPLAPGRFAKIE